MKLHRRTRSVTTRPVAATKLTAVTGGQLKSEAEKRREDHLKALARNWGG